MLVLHSSFAWRAPIQPAMRDLFDTLARLVHSWYEFVAGLDIPVLSDATPMAAWTLDAIARLGAGTIGAIVTVTLASRLLLLPGTWIGMRSRMYILAVRPEVIEIRNRYRAGEIDSDTRMEAVLELYESNRVRVGWFVIQGMVQAFVLALLFRGVMSVAGAEQRWEGPLLEIGAASYAFVVAVAVLQLVAARSLLAGTPRWQLVLVMLSICWGATFMLSMPIAVFAYVATLSASITAEALGIIKRLERRHPVRIPAEIPHDGTYVMRPFRLKQVTASALWKPRWRRSQRDTDEAETQTGELMQPDAASSEVDRAA
jgi:membrane protein insertase Oxa1/YidC/SpoIIIJ